MSVASRRPRSSAALNVQGGSGVGRRAKGETYQHVGQLRLLLPDGGITEDARAEAARELALLGAGESLSGVAAGLVGTLVQFPWLVKDHAPINHVTHDGYVDRLGAVARE
jgi:hypothetical protein